MDPAHALDYLVHAVSICFGNVFVIKHDKTTLASQKLRSLVPKPKTTVIGLGVRLVHT